MDNSVTIPQKEFNNLTERIAHLENMVYKIAEKVGVMPEEIEPDYGSDAWWEKEIHEGLDDIKHGRYVTLKTPDELQQFLDSLK